MGEAQQTNEKQIADNIRAVVAQLNKAIREAALFDIQVEIEDIDMVMHNAAPYKIYTAKIYRRI